MRWQNPVTYDVTAISEVFHTRELHEDFSDASCYFQWDVLVAEFAEVLRGSYSVRDTELDDLLDYFEKLDRRYNLDEDREELLEMLETAEWLD